MVIGAKTTMTLERYSDVADSFGGMTRTWAGKRYLRGVFQATRGDENPRANKPTVVSTHKFYIDTPIGITITEKDRLKYGIRIFNITFINDQGSFFELYLIEKV